MSYNGIENVARKGRLQFMISQQQLTEIEHLFESSNFQSLENSIDKKIRDLPVTVLSYQNKKLEFQGNKIPEEIKKIITYLEDLISQY